MTRRDWYSELEACDEHPVCSEVERRLSDCAEYREVCERVQNVGQRLSAQLRGTPAKLWLDVEAALNDRFAIMLNEYYNVGVDDGLGRGLLDDLLAGPRPPIAAILRALAAALDRLARVADGAE